MYLLDRFLAEKTKTIVRKTIFFRFVKWNRRRHHQGFTKPTTEPLITSRLRHTFMKRWLLLCLPTKTDTSSIIFSLSRTHIICVIAVAGFVSCNLDVVTYYSRYPNENKFVIRGNAQKGVIIPRKLCWPTFEKAQLPKRIHYASLISPKNHEHFTFLLQKGSCTSSRKRTLTN